MKHGFSRTVLSQVSLSGVAAQIEETHWEPGSEVSHCPSILELRLRLWPKRIFIQSWLEFESPHPTPSMFLIPPNIQSRGRGSGQIENVRSLVFTINEDWFRNTIDDRIDWRSVNKSSLLNFRNIYVEQTLRRVAAEVMMADSCSAAMLKSFATMLAIDLHRQFSTSQNPAQRIIQKHAERRVQNIKDYIVNHEKARPTLAEIASHSRISSGYVRQLFKATTGQTIFEFIEENRITRAKGALSENKLSLKEIAHNLGYCDPSAFSMAFKKSTGLTPLQHRKQVGLHIA